MMFAIKPSSVKDIFFVERHSDDGVVSTVLVSAKHPVSHLLETLHEMGFGPGDQLEVLDADD